MSFSEDLKKLLEQEEIETVSNAFGGPKAAGRTQSYSVAKIRDWILEQQYTEETSIERILKAAQEELHSGIFKKIIGNLVRFSFLIELTNLTVGSTKMKTRWLPGLILMPQHGSFEPVRGSFEPGNDPRSADFNACCEVFSFCLKLVLEKIQGNNKVAEHLSNLSQNTSVPYEFVFDYIDPSLDPVHTKGNIRWSLNGDILWLTKARPIIYPILTTQQKNKIQTKTYKTDRALTGKDKTNRAKRWEVLAGDFQHASLTECWSVEKKLLAELVGFNGFPQQTKSELINEGLVLDGDMTKCPVTLEPLDYEVLSAPAIHGRSDFQVGHLHPLKRGGKHDGVNVCWQSSDGNRIQGDFSIEETIDMINKIIRRREQETKTHLEVVEDEIAQEG